MARSKSQNKKQQKTAKTSALVALIIAVLFGVFGALAFWAHTFTNNMVKEELSAQKIYFPEKGSQALDPQEYPDLQQFAGQLVDTPEKAKAYANGYIGRHLNNVADGKVYAEVSALARQDPTNQELQKQKETLFQGETLRGMLLTSGYGFGTIGNIAGIVAYAAFAVAAVALALAAILHRKSQ